ncbi:MAG: hypothetical protein ACE3JK_10580 [Sporolactobacillus sp.]
MSLEYISFIEIFVEANDHLDRVEKELLLLNQMCDQIERQKYNIEEE